APAADVLVEPAQEGRVLVGGERPLAPRRTAAEVALLAHEQPGDRAHPRDQHDEHDPGPLGQAADLLVLRLHTVGEREDAQSDGENCDDAAGHTRRLGNAADRGPGSGAGKTRAARNTLGPCATSCSTPSSAWVSGPCSGGGW